MYINKAKKIVLKIGSSNLVDKQGKLKEKWLKETKLGTPTIATTDEDVASAMNAALVLKAGFQSFMISGDYEQKTMNLSKASRMLDWKPQARPIN